MMDRVTHGYHCHQSWAEATQITDLNSAPPVKFHGLYLDVIGYALLITLLRSEIPSSFMQA